MYLNRDFFVAVGKQCRTEKAQTVKGKGRQDKVGWGWAGG